MFVASAASEAISESSDEIPIVDLFSEREDEFESMFLPSIKRLKDFEREESFIPYHRHRTEEELLEIVRHHSRRIRELEEILEDYL